jgi:excisionase family DNA binding protein
MIEKQEKLISAEALAELLSVHRATVYLWASQNFIPSVRINSRLIRFRVSEVMKAIEGKTVVALKKSKTIITRKKRSHT